MSKEEKEKKILVVKNLPSQEVREIKDSDSGEDYDLITESEALTEMYNDIKFIKKQIG